MIFMIAQWLGMRFNMLRTDSERGAAAVEYGLLVALIAAVIVIAVTFLGAGVRDTFCGVNDALGFGEPCPTPAP